MSVIFSFFDLVRLIFILSLFQTQLPVIDSPLSNRIRKIIEQIQSQRQRYLKVKRINFIFINFCYCFLLINLFHWLFFFPQLTVVRQRDKLEPWFKHYIVEDKGFHSSHLSYVDFLCHVHKEIRNLLN